MPLGNNQGNTNNKKSPNKGTLISVYTQPLYCNISCNVKSRRCKRSNIQNNKDQIESANALFGKITNSTLANRFSGTIIQPNKPMANKLTANPQRETLPNSQRLIGSKAIDIQSCNLNKPANCCPSLPAKLKVGLTNACDTCELCFASCFLSQRWL